MSAARMADRYAVVGHPVAHSKSPFIHASFARQTGEQLVYEAIDVAPGSFEDRVTAFFSGEGRGLNVTLPYKEQAWELALRRSRAAELAGAVNTLFLDDQGRLSGENTDGIGLLRDLLNNHHALLRARRILLLGAGGAVRGVLGPLLEQAPASITVVNRTLARAEALAQQFAGIGRITAGSYQDLEAEPVSYDLIINGTSAGLQGEVPPLPGHTVAAHTWCYDMLYGNTDTPFQSWARKSGAARSLDGLGMLVEQAAEAFHLWRGVMPDTGPVLAALRQHSGSSPAITRPAEPDSDP